MARSTKILNASFDGFKGIDNLASHSGKPTVADLCNFRVMENGSLTKRCGSGIIANHFQSCNMAWGTRLNGSHKYYYCSYPSVFLCDVYPSLLGSLPYRDSNYGFFRYNGRVYLNACQKIFLAEPGLTQEIGYVPLLGKDWSTPYPGEIYEPMNFLNRYARITYVIPELPMAMLPTKYPVKNIISVYRNGELLSSEDYSFNERFNTIDIQDGVSTGETYMAVVEFDSATSEYSDTFVTAKDAATFGEMTDNRVFLWGGSETNRFFVSRNVSDESLTASKEAVANSSGLYFCENDTFIVGDGKNTITSICQLDDKIFIFTTDDVWVTDADLPSNGILPHITSYSQAGGTTNGGAVCVGGSIICIGRNAIMKWSFDKSENGKLTARTISGPITGLVDRSFFESAKACYDPSRNEVWFTIPTGTLCTVWVYGVSTEQWSRFELSSINGIFEGDNSVGFHTPYGLRSMSESATVDNISTTVTEQITPTMKSGILDFGSSNKKRLTEIELVGDLKGESIEITISCDTGETLTLNLSSDAEHAVVRQRISTGRFTTAVLSLKGSSNLAQTIHSIKLTAKEKLS